jgi:hypothetical protein
MRRGKICSTPLEIMGTSNCLESYLSEITALRAFEVGALDDSLINYFAIGPVLAPNRGQERSVFCDQQTV